MQAGNYRTRPQDFHGSYQIQRIVRFPAHLTSMLEPESPRALEDGAVTTGGVCCAVRDNSVRRATAGPRCCSLHCALHQCCCLEAGSTGRDAGCLRVGCGVWFYVARAYVDFTFYKIEYERKVD